jgi:hypothetical protein
MIKIETKSPKLKTLSGVDAVEELALAKAKINRMHDLLEAKKIKELVRT